MKARLIEDGGSASADPHNFFRGPEFLRAESVTHTLEVESESEPLRLPLVVRPIEGTDLADATSPYGYPGGSGGPEPPPAADEVDWSESGLVSLFVRDRIGKRECLAGGTVRSEVHIAEGKEGIRKRLREQIRRNERRGWRVASTPGPEVDESRREAFERAYAQTMARTGATDRYLYPSEYFEELLRSDRAWLLLATNEEGSDGATGAIAVVSDGHLHYYLGGTDDEALDDSPMKNLFTGMISLASELGMPLNLGGGVSPGDSLDDFKRGFATHSAPFRTHEVVCDPAAYERLSASAGPSQGFFPAYRA